MTHPSNVPDSDPIVRLERELSRVSDALKRTERSLGGFQWALALLVIGGIAAVVLARKGVIDLKQVLNQPEIAAKVASRGFDMFNRQDKRVMLAEDDRFGYPSLVFLDNNLGSRMWITMTPDTEGGAPMVALYDNTGTRAQYRMGPKGESLIRLLGENKKGGITMSVTRDGSPSLTLTDASGKVLFHVPEGTPPPTDPFQSTRPRR